VIHVLYFFSLRLAMAIEFSPKIVLFEMERNVRTPFAYVCFGTLDTDDFSTS